MRNGIPDFDSLIFFLMHLELQFVCSVAWNKGLSYHWSNTLRIFRFNKLTLSKNLYDSSPFKAQLLPIYQQLNLMNLCQINELEILKFFMLKYENKTLPNCFKNYFKTPSESHNYPIRFAYDDNWADAFQNKKFTTKRSIQYNWVWNLEWLVIRNWKVI